MTKRAGVFRRRREPGGIRLTALARQLAVSQPTETPELSQIPLPQSSAVEHRRKTSRSGRGAFRANAVTLLVAIALVFVGWRIVLDTATDQHAVAATKSELMGLSNSAALLDQSAFDQLKVTDGMGDFGEARRLAEQAVTSDPLDTHALALLAMAADRDGDRQRADELMDFAAKRTFHDPMIESWMLLRNLQQKDFDAALSHADVLLRTHPELRPLTLRMFIAMIGRPTARHAMVEMLSTAPPWRLGLLSELCNRIAATDRLVELYFDLENSPNPPTVDELRPYLKRLVAAGRYRDAHRDWLSMGPSKSERDLEAQPFDGNFAVDPSGTPFDWTLDSIPGARIDIVSTPGDSTGRALRVQFSGARVAFKNVSQLLLLAPGEYHLSGLTRANELQTPRGLWWQVECADQPNATLGQSDLVLGTLPWTSFGVDFQVPAKGCQAQWLQLELPARTSTEHRIAGEVWYRNLRISTKMAQGAASLVH